MAGPPMVRAQAKQLLVAFTTIDFVQCKINAAQPLRCTQVRKSLLSLLCDEAAMAYVVAGSRLSSRSVLARHRPSAEAANRGGAASAAPAASAIPCGDRSGAAPAGTAKPRRS